MEGLAELQDFAADVLEYYPRCRLHGRALHARRGARPADAGDPQALAAFAGAELRRRGIELRLGTTIERVSADSVELSDGEVDPDAHRRLDGGREAAPDRGRLGLPLDDTGRIKVDRYCQVEGFDDVWAIGDAAAVPDPARPGQRVPADLPARDPPGPHGRPQRRRRARRRARKKPFTYKTLGVFVDMGRHQAVAETLGIRWRGFPAWFLARTYHLSQMPGTRRRVRLVTDWTVGLLFGRDTSELGQLGHPPALAATRCSRSRARAGTTGPRAPPLTARRSRWSSPARRCTRCGTRCSPTREDTHATHGGGAAGRRGRCSRPSRR